MNAPVHASDDLPDVTESAIDDGPAAASREGGDYWTRTCGVPWERISKAVQAVGQRTLRTSRPPRDGAS